MVHSRDMNASAIAEHAWQKQHHADLLSTEVVDLEQFLCPRLMLESWFVHIYNVIMLRAVWDYCLSLRVKAISLDEWLSLVC